MTTDSGISVWQDRTTMVRHFLRTATGGAAVLFGAAVAALVWANVDAASYREVWGAHLGIRLNAAEVELTLREWVNSGLMTLFFFVVGLETRREFDLGELRARRRVVIPVVAGVSGMVVPAVIFVAVNAGRPSMHAWGVAISTDTALALGILALVGRTMPTQLRVLLLTLSVVDDLLALAVIGTVYSDDVRWQPLLVGFGVFGVVLIARAARLQVGLVYFLLAAACWLAVLQAGVEPIAVGLAMGLIGYAYPARRDRLQRASDLFRRFREQPTADRAHELRVGVSSALSPNDRLQRLYQPWTSYVIVPLFALANAGIVLSGEALARAATSPITIGVVLGLLVGKPLGTAGSIWLLGRMTRGRIDVPVGWAAVLGGGTVSIVAFTVSLLVASLALDGEDLEAATLGVLVTTPLAAIATWGVFRLTARLPKMSRARALYGAASTITDLVVPVDPAVDHVRGSTDALVTLVEYGDFECPYCGRAEPLVRALLADLDDLRYVWRHLPLTDVHPHAQVAAEAAEVAGAQGAFWPMHDLLFRHQDALRRTDLIGYAQRLGLDADRFRDDLDGRAGAARVATDADSADLSGVSGTPTFFINGRRHDGAYDVATLKAAIRTAKVQAYLAAGGVPRWEGAGTAGREGRA